MLKKRPFLLIGIIGLFIIGGAYFLKKAYPQDAPYMAPRFSSPVVFFQFIQSPLEVDSFFGVTDYSFDSDNMISKMDKGNKLDFGFAFIYSLFFFLFFKQLAHESEQKWYKIGMLLAVLALIGDVMENMQLLNITSNIVTGDYEGSIRLLPVFTWMKWASLAIGFAIYGLWLLKLEGVLRLMGYIAFVPVFLGVMAVFKRGLMTELFTRTITIMFFVAISYCFMYKNDMKPEKEEEPIV